MAALKLFPPLRGHALTTFEGRFLNADENFLEIVGRSASRLQELTVIDVTHVSDRAWNHQQLDRLRLTGEPFEIVKKYVRDNGKIIHVKNHVSLFRDGIGDSRIIASTEVLDQAATEERNQLAIAIAILANQTFRPLSGMAGGLEERHWKSILSLYILEQQGSATFFDDICNAANLTPSSGYLVLLELIGRGWIDMDHRGAGLHDSSAILTAAGRNFLADHLEDILEDVAHAIRLR